jgi:hypothetical protein
MRQRDSKGGKDGRDGAQWKAARQVPSNPDGFIPPHGGYEQLHSYQKALIVYRATRYFCRRFIDKKDRTFDQMVQAARSGKQNIVECRVSLKTGILCAIKTGLGFRRPGSGGGFEGGIVWMAGI